LSQSVADETTRRGSKEVMANEQLVPVRKQLIERILAQYAQPGADVAAQVWSPLAAELILIVGQGGFDALFERSCRLAGIPFSRVVQTGNAGPALRFDTLFFHPGIVPASIAVSIDATEAMTANRTLLLAFSDVLASLIGESLTNTILCSACRIDMDDLYEEGQNE